MRWAFVFGKNWMLSLAEILAYFETERTRWKFVDMSKKALVLDADIDPQRVINDLGGTLKIVQITKEFKFKDLEKQDFGEYVNWWISLYASRALLKDLRKVFKKIPKDGILSHTDIVRRKIKEVSLIFGLRTCHFGETVAVANPFDFKKRDLQRATKPLLLVMSPSRARILVNLSGAKRSLLDPFCGNGTVGQEALLRGVEKVYLSDIDKKCIARTKRNMARVKRERKLRGKTVVQTCDARNLGQCYAKGTIEAIATEPDLGPRLQYRVSKRDAEKIVAYLTLLYKSFFNSAQSMLRPGARIAMVFPCINSRAGKVFVNKRFQGFKLVEPFHAIPGPYRKHLKMRRMIVDEEREKGKMRVTAREFAIFVVRKD